MSIDEFDAAFDMPSTPEQALAVLKEWSDPLVATFNAEKAKRIYGLLAARAQVTDQPDELSHLTDLLAQRDEFIVSQGLWQVFVKSLPHEPTRPKRESSYPECSGNPASCPENEGYGCCKPNPRGSHE